MSGAKNHLFFSQVLEQVGKLSTTVIIGAYTKTHVNRYADNDALCPFHGDTTFGNFKINDKKGICKCFTCGYYGDAIQFVRDYFQLGFKPAVLKIGVDQGIIIEEQAEEYLGGKISDMDIRAVSTNKMKGKEKPNGITKIAIPSVRDWAYQLFLKCVTLSDEHRDYLRSRGLSDEEINEKGFFTFPEPTETFLNELHGLCKRNQLTYNLFKCVPGFHTTPDSVLDSVQRTGEQEYWYTFSKRKGIGIPQKDAYGNIHAIQIRRDTVNDKRKRYTWFSSSYAAYDDNDYIFGTPAGAPTHVAYPKENRYPDVVFITEGYFKAEEVAKTFGAVCLSMSGVGNYRTVNEDLKAIQGVLKHPIDHIYVAYDADMSKNLQVYHHAKNMVALIREEFKDAEIYMTLWKEEDGKGIDDLIQNGKESTLQKVEFNDFSLLYDGMVERLEEQYQIINRIPKEVVEDIFYHDIFPKVYAS